MFRFLLRNSLFSMVQSRKVRRLKMARPHRSVRLRLEELENRVVPADLVETTAYGPADSVRFSPAEQEVTVRAFVVDLSNGPGPLPKVNEGFVTFTILDTSEKAVGTPQTVQVDEDGGASTSYKLPAAEPVDYPYTVEAAYSDPSSNPKFLESKKQVDKFKIYKDFTIVRSDNSTKYYSPQGTVVLLKATIKDNNHQNPQLNVIEGKLKLTISAGGQDYSAEADVVKEYNTYSRYIKLPPTVGPGLYDVTINYSGSNNYLPSDYKFSYLTILSAPTRAMALPAGVDFNPNSQTVQLSVAITDLDDSSIPVNEGAVTFTIPGIGVTQGQVIDDHAFASLLIPGGEPVGSYPIYVSFSDSSGDFVDSGDAGSTLTIICPPCAAVASASANQMTQNLGTYFGTITTQVFQSAQTVLNTFSAVLQGQEPAADLVEALVQFYQWILLIQEVEQGVSDFVPPTIGSNPPPPGGNAAFAPGVIIVGNPNAPPPPPPLQNGNP